MTAQAVLVEVDKLEVSLSRAEYRDDERARISSRLKSLLMTWGDPSAAKGDQQKESDLESADMESSSSTMSSILSDTQS